jgi:alkylhydroperoxidase family enzyme
MAEHPSTTRAFDTVLADRPDVLEHLSAAHQAALDAVEPRLLELCRRRIGSLLGSEAEEGSGLDDQTIAALPQWPSSELFSETERVCLAFTEQFVIDVATLDDPTAFAVVEALGAQGFADFASALLVVEQRQRLQLIWQQLFTEVPT